MASLVDLTQKILEDPTKFTPGAIAEEVIKRFYPVPPEVLSDERIDFVPEQFIDSHTARYQLVGQIKFGTFSQMIKLNKIHTNQIVMAKVKRRCAQNRLSAEAEVEILTLLNKEDVDRYCIVKLYDAFWYCSHRCIVYELLGQNLEDFIRENNYEPVPLESIRKVACQLLLALFKLKELGVIHTDLKLQNIMLVDPYHQPFRVKLIDFGNAVMRTHIMINMSSQSRMYHSPEVLLGMAFTEAIDMWSLGCILTELFLGSPLFTGSCGYDQLRFITATLGLPDKKMLDTAPLTRKYFYVNQDCMHNSWRLKSLEEYKSNSQDQSFETRKYAFKSLDNIANVRFNFPYDYKRLNEFISVIKKMLETNPQCRGVPQELMQYSFLIPENFW